MILRIFLVFGLALIGVTGYFTVVQAPPSVQQPPGMAEVSRWQEEGILPGGELAENDEVEHGIFEVPPMDEMMLDAAMEAMGEMPGMDMSGGTMSGMDMSGDDSMDMAGESGAMDMSGDGSMDMAGESGTMDMSGDGSMDMAGDSGTMDMSSGGSMDMAEMAVECEGEGGLSFCPDGARAAREISLTMREWEFDQMAIDVNAGERIRFTVKNDGQVLHEFMFMTMPLMQAVEYRAERADWSLLEHEALFEKSLLLPGQEMSFVVEVQQAGSWMFMCMLPYHMQLGMMGQMSTPGAAMEM